MPVHQKSLDEPPQASEAPKAAAPPRVLGSAAGSGDAAVQHLIAEREIAGRNGDTAAVETLTLLLAEHWGVA